MSVVKDVEVQWAHVQRPNQYDSYSIDAFIPKELAKKFTDEGVGGIKKDKKGKVQKNKAGGVCWQFKTNAIDKDGNVVPKPRIVDKGKNPIDVLVGNGSVCNIQYNVKPWAYKSKKGISPYLQGVQVMELVEYAGADEFENESGEEDEFDAPAGVEDIDDDDPFGDD